MRGRLDRSPSRARATIALPARKKSAEPRLSRRAGIASVIPFWPASSAARYAVVKS